jgi:hypothetical protein
MKRTFFLAAATAVLTYIPLGNRASFLALP